VTELAVVILAHRDPTHLKRLIGALDGLPIVLHVDAKTPPGVHAEMTSGLPKQVVLSPRLRTSLASWSLVEAEVLGVRMALTHTRAEHIAVLSGADYPLASVPAILADLRAWQGRSLIWNVPLPFSPWDTPRHKDGGLWRVQRRFLTWRDQVLVVQNIPMRWPYPRQVPALYELRASSQWKIYSREHARSLIDILDRLPEVRSFWRTTLVPEESCIASVLSSAALLGSSRLEPSLAHPWFIEWPEGVAYHPLWLEEAAFTRLHDARLRPTTAFEESGGQENEDAERRFVKLFARKLSTDHSGTLLDRIDRELRT